jgi:hypothetical protein
MPPESIVIPNESLSQQVLTICGVCGTALHLLIGVFRGWVE